MMKGKAVKDRLVVKEKCAKEKKKIKIEKKVKVTPELELNCSKSTLKMVDSFRTKCHADRFNERGGQIRKDNKYNSY